MLRIILCFPPGYTMLTTNAFNTPMLNVHINAPLSIKRRMHKCVYFAWIVPHVILFGETLYYQPESEMRTCLFSHGVRVLNVTLHVVYLLWVCLLCLNLSPSLLRTRLVFSSVLYWLATPPRQCLKQCHHDLTCPSSIRTPISLLVCPFIHFFFLITP